MNNIKLFLFNSLTFNFILCIVFLIGYITPLFFHKSPIIDYNSFTDIVTVYFWVPGLIMIIVIGFIHLYYSLKLFKRKVIIREYDENGFFRDDTIVVCMVQLVTALVGVFLWMYYFTYPDLILRLLQKPILFINYGLIYLSILPVITLIGRSDIKLSLKYIKDQKHYKINYFESLGLKINSYDNVFLAIAHKTVILTIIGEITIKLKKHIPYVTYKNIAVPASNVKEYIEIKDCLLTDLNEDDFKIIQMMAI